MHIIRYKEVRLGFRTGETFSKVIIYNLLLIIYNLLLIIYNLLLIIYNLLLMLSVMGFRETGEERYFNTILTRPEPKPSIICPRPSISRRNRFAIYYNYVMIYYL